MDEDKKLLINYKSLIENFENIYVKSTFDNYEKYNQLTGYIITLESYEDLKNAINSQIYGNFSSSKILENQTKLKALEIKTSQYLISMLLNDNKYIIINDKLWNLLGEKEKNNSPISYYIDDDYIIFKLDDNIQLKFYCWRHNNIIDEFSFKEEDNLIYYSKLNSGFNKITKIYDQINEYYNFENELLQNSNQKKDNQYNKKLGCLVELNWLQKWKEIINYEKLKKHFRIKDTEKNIKNKIIFFTEKNKVGLQYPIVKIFGSEEEFKYYIKNNSLALVN